MEPVQRAKLLNTIEDLDCRRRASKADRVEWLSLHEPRRPAAVMGRTETMHLMNEARDVFVDGHFVATLLLALSFIEHAVVEELQLLGHVKGSPTLSTAIVIAEQRKTFPVDWLRRAKVLAQRRNPFAHLKSGDHPHGLGRRLQLERAHPRSLLEADAKDAIDLMYNFFVATLREVQLGSEGEA